MIGFYKVDEVIAADIRSELIFGKLHYLAIALQKRLPIAAAEIFHLPEAVIVKSGCFGIRAPAAVVTAGIMPA